MSRDRIAQLQKIRGQLSREGTMTTHDGDLHDVRTVSITEREGEALYNWILREKAARTIEIGLAYGFSGLYICEGLLRLKDEAARHTALDPFQDTRFANGGLKNFQDAGVSGLVTHIPEPSHFALPRLLENDARFDLAFVDGNHRFDYVFLDLFFLGKLVRKGGIIILDDTNLPGIKKAVDFFPANLNWTIEEVSPQDDLHSWIVLRTALEDDTRDFTFFRDF